MSHPALAPLLSAIRAVVDWLAAAAIPGAVIGGIGASIHGRPRVTKDVDVVILADLSDCAALIASAAKYQLVPREVDPVEFAQVTRVLLLRHELSGIDIDLSFGELPFERELVQRSQQVTVDGVTFPVARAEDLVIMKTLALRPRDVADIEAILEANPAVDLARIRQVVDEFSHLLEEGDLRSELDRIITKVRGRGI
jgi:hypothetical protein